MGDPPVSIRDPASGPPPPARASWVGVALGVLLAIAAAVRLYDLGAQATWADELCRIVWSKGYEFDRWFGFLPGETGARLPPRPLKPALRVVSAHNPPLYGALLNLWMRAVGSESDLAARLPSALLGLLSVLGMFLAARRLLGPRVALWATALVALSPFHVFYAQEVNHYTLVACLVAFSLWFHFRWLERPSALSGAGIAVTGLGALYAHYFAGIALALQALELAIRHRRSPRRLALDAVPYAAIAAGFAPYLPTLWRQLRELTHPSMVGGFAGAHYLGERMLALAVVPWLGERGEHLEPLVGLPIAALTVTLVVVGLRAVRDAATRRVLVLNALGPLLASIALFWALRSNSAVWSRYQLAFTFAQLIPVAAALEATRRWRWIAAAALAVLAAIGLRFQLFELVKEDWKGATAAISSRGPDDDPVLVYRANLAYAIARYLPSERRLFGIEDGEHLPLLVATATEGRQAVWFVSAWAEGTAPSRIHDLLACRYARREDFPVSRGRVGLTVTRYTDPYPSPEAMGGPPPEANSGCPAPAPVGTAAWERASDGPALEAAGLDAPSRGETSAAARSVGVAGWAFSTRGIRSLAFEVDGRERGRSRHLGLLRADVAAAYPAAPAAHALHSGFSGVVDLEGLSPGVHAFELVAVHEDGSTARLAASDIVVAGKRGEARLRP